MGNRLLTGEEIQKVVRNWMSGDFSVRVISLNRGHWEDIAPIIAEAQATLTCEETLKEVGEWLNDRPRTYPMAGGVFFLIGDADIKAFLRGKKPGGMK